MKKPGHPKEYSDRQIAFICVIMELKKIHDFNGIIKYLEKEKKLCQVIGLSKVPHRTTLSRRAKTIHKKLREMIRALGNYHCQSFSERHLMASEDGSLFESQGPKWHKKYRNMGITPGKLRNVDRESKWGFSPTKGWVQGYKGHFNVVFDPSDKEFVPFPIDAVVTTANVSDFAKGATLFSHLAKNVLVQLADKGYDNQDFFIKLWKRGKVFVTPIKKNERKEGINLVRNLLYQISLALKVYQKRNVTIEPFNGRIKSLFHLNPLPVKGKKKVKLVILSAVLSYQLIVMYNMKSHRKMGAVKEVLDLL